MTRREKKLAEIGQRLEAVKLLAETTRSLAGIRRCKSELASIGDALAKLPPLPADHIEQHIRQAMRAGWTSPIAKQSPPEQRSTAPAALSGFARRRAGKTARKPAQLHGANKQTRTV